MKDLEVTGPFDFNLGYWIGQYDTHPEIYFSKRALSNKVSASESFQFAGDYSKWQQFLNTFNAFIFVGHAKSDEFGLNAHFLINDNDILFAEQFESMNLTIPFVAVLGCNSGKTGIIPSEGLRTGFQRSLHIGGVHSSLTALWEIEDQTNGIYIEQFLNALSLGSSIEEATRTAKLHLLKLSHKGQLQHDPYAWAAYRLTGNGNITYLKASESTRSPLINPWLIIFCVLLLWVAVLRGY
jgi:hypothetical protein